MSGSAEDRLIGWLRRRLRKCGDDLVGDDAAVIRARAETAVTVDQQIAGTHFPPDLDPAVVARRLVAVNLSDLAAMGALPGWAFLALALPPGFDVRRFFDALVRTCARQDLTLAGGDVARGDRLHASMTLVGRRPRGGRWLARSAARPGDRICVGGSLGESAAGRLLVQRGARIRSGRVDLPADVPSGLSAVARRAVRRHLTPRPQIELGLRLGRRARVAAIDVSDGLAMDLGRLCRESGVGAVVREPALPASPGFEPLCEYLGAAPTELQLGGGEDYVLLFTLPGGAGGAIPPQCHEIGSVSTSKGLRLATPSGSGRLPETGWDHLSRA